MYADFDLESYARNKLCSQTKTADLREPAHPEGSVGLEIELGGAGIGWELYESESLKSTKTQDVRWCSKMFKEDNESGKVFQK